MLTQMVAYQKHNAVKYFFLSDASPNGWEHKVSPDVGQHLSTELANGRADSEYHFFLKKYVFKKSFLMKKKLRKGSYFSVL